MTVCILVFYICTCMLSIVVNGLRLSSLFENSTKIREYIILQNQLSPAIVDAFFDTLIDPTKVCSDWFS